MQPPHTFGLPPSSAQTGENSTSARLLSANPEKWTGIENTFQHIPEDFVRRLPNRRSVPGMAHSDIDAEPPDEGRERPLFADST
jgi:hypothetical protein